ncbi:MAG: GNAT family N-acetyltransferase [Microbacteriaceae bacterium]
MNTETPVEVLHQPDEHRFVICQDGKIAGRAEYLTKGDARVFIHTVIDPEYAGQGLAVKLVNKALKNTQDSGLRIVPVCPFVAAFLKRNHDFTASVDAVTPELLEEIRVNK